MIFRRSNYVAAHRESTKKCRVKEKRTQPELE